MGSEANRLRSKWQDRTGNLAALAEYEFFNVFNDFFRGTDFIIRKKPNEFKNIYLDYILDDTTLNEIYTPEKPITRHGVTPDFAIDNKVSGKTIYVEVKKQDGWVEGKTRYDGRGNAHERSCKFFTPGLRQILYQKSNLTDDTLPFWVVFQGDITRDPCRVREISLWYGEEYKHHKFFWRNTQKPDALIQHFMDNILPLLE